MQRLALTLALLAAAACDQGSEEAFIRDRAFDPCIQSIPACPGLYAACTLDGTRYTRQSFPGAFRFVVRADPRSKIEVQMFLSEQRDAGIETRIFWNEPGCSDVYVYDSEGKNLFEEFEDTHTIALRETLYEGGEHLVEIISDMQARTVIGVDIIEPES